MFFDEDIQKTNDDTVRGTNDDATISRLSAATLGYLKDPFVQYFVKKPVRRSPIINRGTFVRNFAIDSLVSQFLSIPGSKKQIVTLGAGFDTRYFNIKAGHLDKDDTKGSASLSKYIEIDFPEITTKKAMIIKKKQELSSLLGTPETVKLGRGGIDLLSSEYSLLGADLRAWSNIGEKIIEVGLDLDLPTLFISECVFIYLLPEDSNKILKWITEKMNNVIFVLYEQIKPDDAFGKMMIHNLRGRNIELKGIHAFPDLLHQENRFKVLGWQDARAVDVNMIHDQYLEKSEISRMAKLEILDELEEWRLLSAHYCVAWAYKANDFAETFSGIQLLQQQPSLVRK